VQTGVAVPNYIGLSLQQHVGYFHQAACDFARTLAANFQVELSVPPGPSSKDADCLPPAPSEVAAISSSVTFRWPHVLHMTAFFLGGGRRAAERQLPLGALQALKMEGSLWALSVTHLVYAEGALLVAALKLDSGSDKLPLDPGCIPHVTLLSRHPFTPADASEVLLRAAESGLLHSEVTSDGLAIASLPQAAVAGAETDIFVQPLASTRPLEARLESFWDFRL